MTTFISNCVQSNLPKNLIIYVKNVCKNVKNQHVSNGLFGYICRIAMLFIQINSNISKLTKSVKCFVRREQP